MEANVTSENRVNPWGRTFATDEHGYFMGNRSDPKAWITCSLRDPDAAAVTAPVEYQKLFFLDEATALAAGHRPCGQCRRKDYATFKRFWETVSKQPMDQALRNEFSAGRDPEVGYSTRRAEQLPPGAMFEKDGKAYLAWQRLAFLWSPGGYTVAGLLKDFGKVAVLTPTTTELVLEAGYRPWVHPSVLRA